MRVRTQASLLDDETVPAIVVARQLDYLLNLLSSETASAGEPLGPCLELVLRQGVLSTLVKHASRDQPSGFRAEVTKWIGRAVVELDETFLTHGAVNKPL